MEDNFSKLIIETLALQLARGYQITDSYGNTQNMESPLQRIVSKYISDNKENFIKEISLIFEKNEILSEAIKNKIDSDMKNEWTRKNYEEIFLKNMKERVEKEIVKDLGVLLVGKKIIIEIVDDNININN